MVDLAHQQERASSYRWVVISTWLLCNVTAFAILTNIGLLLPAIGSDLRLSPGEQGLLGSAAYWGNIVLGIPLAWWTSRYSPKILTTVTLVLGVLLLFAQGLAPVFAVLILGRLGFGITRIAREPARALLMQQWFQPREVVLVNGVMSALFGVAFGVGMLVTPFILAMVGDNWRATFHVFGIVFAGLTVLWMVVGRERVTQEPERREGRREAGVLKGALWHRDLWITGFGFLGANLAWSAFFSFFPTLMLETYDVSLQWTGGILALGVIVGGIAGLGVSYVVMTVDKRRSILLVQGVAMTATFVGMTLTGSVPLLVILSLLNGIALTFWPILQTVPFQLPGIRPQEVAVAMSALMVMMSAGPALGPLAAGYLQELLGDLRLVLLIVSFASLSLCVTSVFLRFGPPRGGAERSEPA